MRSSQPGVRWPRRWPLHPRPGELESLSSWLERLASVYGMSVRDLLGHHNLDVGGVAVPVDVDVDPPQVLLAAVAERTGVGLDRLRAMTLVGWAPWLFDAPGYPRAGDGQEVFDTYVRANSVLLAPGEAGTNQVGYPRRWRGPWHGVRWLHRACPVCAAEPDRGAALVWRLPLTVGCAEHGCRLQDGPPAALAAGLGRAPAPVGEPMAALDRYTYAALSTPGGSSCPAGRCTPECGSGCCARCWTRSAWR